MVATRGTDGLAKSFACAETLRPRHRRESRTPPCHVRETHGAPLAEKIIVALSLATVAAMQPKALAVRGGAAVGPIDEALAMNTARISVAPSS